MGQIRVLGHQVIENNEKADVYGEIGSFLSEIMSCNDVQTPLVVLASKNYDWAFREIKMEYNQKLWNIKGFFVRIIV